ncbi:MAG: AMP-binding protein [Synergistaceae bacterium]|nr:AMP-binding protein [Synergistaceae bacterium]
MDRLNGVLRLAKSRSRFYARVLPEGDALRLESPEDLERIPFTEERDLGLGIEEFLCVPPGDIARIVSLFTSGSTGRPKRVAFTEEDIRATVRYFSFGMRQMTGPGGRVMICLPGSSEYGVPHLLSLGVRDFGGEPVVYGAISDDGPAARFMADFRPDCIVGVPVQVLSLAVRYRREYGEPCLGTALLTTDYAAAGLKRRVSAALGCRVLNHYGSTEMGYGGALECAPGSGLHVRDADLYFEIVEPRSGAALPPGEEGELVFTTLSRGGMPLIRYRTGDCARFVREPCGCGGESMRISAPWRLRGSRVQLPGGRLTLQDLDEILFSSERVKDYSASRVMTSPGSAMLNLRVWSFGELGQCGAAALERRVRPALPCGADVRVEPAGAGEANPGLLGKRFLSQE